METYLLRSRNYVKRYAANRLGIRPGGRVTLSAMPDKVTVKKPF